MTKVSPKSIEEAHEGLARLGLVGDVVEIDDLATVLNCVASSTPCFPLAPGEAAYADLVADVVGAAAEQWIARPPHEQRTPDGIGETPATVEGDELRLA